MSDCSICGRALIDRKCPRHGGAMRIRVYDWWLHNTELVALCAFLAFVIAFLSTLVFFPERVHQSRQSNPVTVFVDGREVFSGPAWQARISSAGATTIVEIYDFSWNQYWLREKYASSDVRVENGIHQ